MQSYPGSRHFLPLWSKYYPQQPVTCTVSNCVRVILTVSCRRTWWRIRSFFQNHNRPVLHVHCTGCLTARHENSLLRSCLSLCDVYMAVLTYRPSEVSWRYYNAGDGIVSSLILILIGWLWLCVVGDNYSCVHQSKFKLFAFVWRQFTIPINCLS
jgi:hypothetical protein